jgi:hypothetical protein
MATTKRRTPSRAASKAVTAERAARLVRLLQFLGTGPQTRTALARRLRLDVRSFYRDLELLRGTGIPLVLSNHRYALAEPAEAAIARLPFPDPHLTLGEARQLAKGRSAAHRKLQELIGQIAGPGTR